MTLAAAPVSPEEPVNRTILAVSEDRIQGFSRYPFARIAEQSGVPVETVLERIRAMLEAGTIRRVRQTLLSTSLARGALVAWSVPPARLDAAFAEMFENDPFSGHVVIRSTDGATPGSQYRLWTTLKVPQGFSIDRHAQYLAERVGATAFRLMPAKKLFALGVGHTRRRGTEPGSRDTEPATIINTELVELDQLEWRVLTALKREFEPRELSLDPWQGRAAEAGVSIEAFIEVGDRLQAKGVIGRFSTFLEHVKELSTGEHVTRYNALFHWEVPPGMELAAGREVGRHHIITHAYWREGGPEFANVNVMAVAHGMEKELVLAHKAAIDVHLAEAGIVPGYTNVFWGGRSEIKPSEVSPIAYREWCVSRGIDPHSMRDATPTEGAPS
ncbi:MAG: Lrp/AsnC family transcriptional regulator [Tepidiformaceae bacterium]